MAEIVWTIVHPSSGQAEFVVDADQILEVPRFIDSSKFKRAGNLVVGESFRNAGVVYTIVSVDVPEA